MVTRKDMPDWLDAFIYKDLGGSYEPDREAFQNNLFSDDEKNLQYLGTYFPRSFTESYCIFSNLFDNPAYIEAVKGKASLSILSFGCGTGGDLMGLLEAIAEKMPWVKNHKVVAFDGNFNAIEMLKTIVEHSANKERFHINIEYTPVPMTCPEDFELYCGVIDSPFDFIMSFKMVNELFRNNIISTRPYMRFLEALIDYLTETGVMLLLDVPLKVNGQWLGLLLSQGLRQFLSKRKDFEAMVPIPCHVKSRVCRERCYFEKMFYGDKFSSEKVIYCMLSRANFAKAVCGSIGSDKYIVNTGGELCKIISGKIERDAYDLKLR